MSVIDKIVSAISPETGLKRIAAKKKINVLNSSGYGNYGASHTKKSMLGWIYRGGSADEDIHSNLSTLRQRSRDLYMGVPIAAGAIKTMRTNVIGSGLKLKSQIDYEVLKMTEQDARNLESIIEREFELWADSPLCDIEKTDNFYELQQLVFLNWLMSGDVIVTLPVNKRINMPYDLRICLIESDRLSTPQHTAGKKIISGIEVNDDGEVVAYHIANSHPLSFDNSEPTHKRVEAYGKNTGRRNVLFIANRERVGQKRGVPFLAPVIESLKQLGRYIDAELVAAVVSGMFTVFIEKESTINDVPFGETISPEQQVDREDVNSVELGAGSIIDLNEGEKANATSPGRPNANFDGFVSSIYKQIGVGLEIPYEVLMKNFNSSYSASRGALLEAWKSFRMYRTWLANDFCQPVFEEWLCEAVAKGRISAPGFFSDPIIQKAYSGAEWNGPAQGLLNPVQEVTAAEKRVQNGFSSREREAMEMTGSNYYRNIQQLKQEEKLMKEVTEIAETENK